MIEDQETFSEISLDADIFCKDNPRLKISKGLMSNKCTAYLSMWDTPEIVDGYSTKELRELVEILEMGIKLLENCNDKTEESLFNDEEREREI